MSEFTKDDLLTFMKEHNACKESYEFVNSCESIEECLEKAPFEYLIWALIKRPHLSYLVNWNKLDGWDWVKLLRKCPEFVNKCDWSKLDDEDWNYLLKVQPQFAKYKT